MKSNLNERKFFLHKIFKTDSDLIQNTKKPSVKLDHKVAKIKKSKENKSRKYDYDSIKKSLVKNLWYYVLEQINLMLNLPKIISSNSNNFKSFKTKEKDKENFNLKVLDLLQKYLGIDEEDLKKQISKKFKEIKEENLRNIKENENYLNLEQFLSKELNQVFNEYRLTDNFFKDALKDSKNDKLKLTKYLTLSKKFINYLNLEGKLMIKVIPDDSNLTDEFYRKYKEALDSFSTTNTTSRLTKKSKLEKLGLKKIDTSLLSKSSFSHEFHSITTSLKKYESETSVKSEINLNNVLIEIYLRLIDNIFMEMRDKLSFNDFKEVIRIMKSKYFASTNKETSNLELLEQKKMKSINKYNPIFNEKNISKNQTAKFN